MQVDLVAKIISIVFSIMLLGNAVLIRRYVGTYLVPAGVFSLMWFLLTFIPLVFLFAVPINPLAILIILLYAIVLSLTTIPFNWIKARRVNPKNIKNIFYGQQLKITNTIWILLVLSFILIAIDVKLQGYQYFDIITNLPYVSGDYASRRYDESLEYSIYSRLAGVFSLVAVSFSGILSVLRNNNSLRFIAFIPAIAIMLLQNSKGIFLNSIIYYFSSVFVGKIAINDISFTKVISFNKRVIPLSIFALLVVYTVLMRSSSDDINILTLILYKFNTYVLAGIFAFSDWLSSYLYRESVMDYGIHSSIEYGFYTFMNIFRLVGDDRFIPQGTYDEYFYHQDYFITNIYTVFRGLILDFGLFGSMIFMMIAGFITNLLTYFVIIEKKPVFSMVLLITALSTILSSGLISLLSYNTTYISLFIMYIILRFLIMKKTV